MSRPAALRLLQVVLLGVGVYSIIMLAAGDTVQLMFEALGFGADGADVPEGSARDYVLFLQGVLGAVILGWVLLMLAVVKHGLTRDPDGPWWSALILSIAGWFVVDSGFSLAVNSWEHAVFNVAFLAALAVPLVSLRPAPGHP